MYSSEADMAKWDEIVEVFELHSHPKATHAYAWTHDTDDPKKLSVA